MYYALTVNCFEGQSQNLHCSLLATPVAKIITFVLTGCSRSFPNMLAARESCANSSPSFFSQIFFSLPRLRFRPEIRESLEMTQKIDTLAITYLVGG
jgi:hypothetical protein